MRPFYGTTMALPGKTSKGRTQTSALAWGAHRGAPLHAPQMKLKGAKKATSLPNCRPRDYSARSLSKYWP